MPSGDLDLTKIGEARKSLVGVKLDQVVPQFLLNPWVNSYCCI